MSLFLSPPSPRPRILPQLLDPVVATKIFKRVVNRAFPIHRFTGGSQCPPQTSDSPRGHAVHGSIPALSPRRRRHFRGVTGRQADLLPRAVGDNATVRAAFEEGSPLHICRGHRGRKERRGRDAERGGRGENVCIPPAAAVDVLRGRRPGNISTKQQHQQRSSSLDRGRDFLRRARHRRPAASPKRGQGRGEVSSFCRVNENLEMKRRQHARDTRRQRQEYERLNFQQFCTAIDGLSNTYAGIDGIVSDACGAEDQRLGEHGEGKDGRAGFRDSGRPGRRSGVTSATSFVGSRLLRLAKVLFFFGGLVVDTYEVGERVEESIFSCENFPDRLSLSFSDRNLALVDVAPPGLHDAQREPFPTSTNEGRP